MQSVTSLEDLRLVQPASLTIGAFDGVHRGHRALIGSLVSEAHAANRAAVVLTFFPHPSVFLRGRRPSFYLSTPEEKAAFQQERTAAIAGKKLADKYGWKVGDVIELKGAIYPLDARLTLRGIYTGPQETNFYFHREFVEEAFGRPGRVGQYRVRIDSPSSAARVMEDIDNLFRNSAAPTKTETEAAFAAGFISMLGNVKGLISGIGLVVVFTITLIGANTMAMSARERFTEVAVMKALGFRPAMILTLMLSEAVLIALFGGALAAIAAKVIFQFVGLGDVLALFLQGFKISAGTIAIALGASALIGLVSGGIPAWNAARINIVDGLRRVA